MRTAVFLLALASLCRADSVCPPVLTPDQQPVNPACPGLGAEVIAEPGAQYHVWFDDQFGAVVTPFSDHDTNDFNFTVSFDLLGNATAAWESADASFNDLGYQGTQFLFSSLSHPNPVALAGGPFAFGSPVEFVILTPQGYAYQTGTGAGNPDGGGPHAWVSRTSGVPEPSTMLFVGAGMLAVAIKRRKSNVD